ncbi:MAG: hypothetical protein IPO52_02580 [Gemmatimonadetes bacterium]|nr:hypothetical protein [Gemmatimonadota bacterium]
MANNLPGRIDRATFDRVLQRAAELQAASHDIGEGLTEDEVVALGNEVGIAPQVLKQALLEERTRIAPMEPKGVLDEWVAPAELRAERVVQGTEASVSAALTAWIDKHEHFVVQRATLGRTTYEPLDTLAGAMRKMKRVFEGASAKPYQNDTELLTAVITPLEDGFCHVAVMATLRRSRRNYVTGASVLAGTGVAITAGVMALVQYPAAELLAMIPAVAGLGTGALTARSFRPISARAQLGLERMLDDLERRPALAAGSPPPRSQQIAREVGQVVKDITREVRKALEEK